MIKDALCTGRYSSKIFDLYQSLSNCSFVTKFWLKTVQLSNYVLIKSKGIWGTVSWYSCRISICGPVASKNTLNWINWALFSKDALCPAKIFWTLKNIWILEKKCANLNKYTFSPMLSNEKVYLFKTAPFIL